MECVRGWTPRPLFLYLSANRHNYPRSAPHCVVSRRHLSHSWASIKHSITGHSFSPLYNHTTTTLHCDNVFTARQELLRQFYIVTAPYAPRLFCVLTYNIISFLLVIPYFPQLKHLDENLTILIPIATTVLTLLLAHIARFILDNQDPTTTSLLVVHMILYGCSVSSVACKSLIH
jgi:hypothetical protein